MSFTISDIIKITAEAIHGGISPMKLINDPTKILSGETMELVTSKKGNHVRLSECIIDRLISLGETIDKESLDWKYFHGIPTPETKYAEFKDRKNDTLIKLIHLGEIKNLAVVKVPVETWSWTIECTSDIFAQEYIAYFI
jgi:hypothetical protein